MYDQARLLVVFKAMPTRKGPFTTGSTSAPDIVLARKNAGIDGAFRVRTFDRWNGADFLAIQDALWHLFWNGIKPVFVLRVFPVGVS